MACGSIVEEKQLQVNIDSGSNCIIIKRVYFFNQLNCLWTTLRTANGQATLQVEGFGEIWKCDDMQFCPEAWTELNSVSKLTAIGLKINFGDEESQSSFIVDRPTRFAALGLRSMSYFGSRWKVFKTLSILMEDHWKKRWVAETWDCSTIFDVRSTSYSHIRVETTCVSFLKSSRRNLFQLTK